MTPPGEPTRANNTRTMTTPVGRETVVEYNADGHIARRAFGPLLARTFTYDGAGRIDDITEGTRDRISEPISA